MVTGRGQGLGRGRGQGLVRGRGRGQVRGVGLATANHRPGDDVTTPEPLLYRGPSSLPVWLTGWLADCFFGTFFASLVHHRPVSQHHESGEDDPSELWAAGPPGGVRGGHHADPRPVQVNETDRWSRLGTNNKVLRLLLD